MPEPEIISLLTSGLELHQAGRLAEAEALYARVRAAHPGNFDAAHLGGTAALQQGRFSEAAMLLAAARGLDPRSAVCAMRLGLALASLGRPAEAERELRAAATLDAALPEAWFHLGRVLEQAGRPARAVEALERAVALNPLYAEALNQLGALLTSTRGNAAAEPVFRRATEADPACARAWCNLGICLTYLGRLGEALGCFDRALRLEPKFGHAYAGRGLALERCHRLVEAVEDYGRAVAADPRNHQARSARLLVLHYLEGVTREALFREHQAYGRAVAAAQPTAAEIEKPRAPALRSLGEGGGGDANRRIRVGFLSPNLRRHSVAYFLLPLLEHLDPARFEVYLYHDHAQTDAMSDRLRARAACWRPVAGASATALEALLRADRLDVLVDLAAHSDLNRLPVLARRLAPVQATYLGYPDTTGLDAVNYRLVDAVTDPEGEADRFCTEKLVRFAPTAWCYSPPSEAPEPRAHGGPATFGCFNNFAKVTDGTFRLWARVLEAAPGSRLLVKGSGLADPTLQAEARRRMAEAGIPLDRLELLGRTASQAEHLLAYARVDVALDTFPYHGTTTTCEALWMGVPVVTLRGDRHASRVGASLLQAVGHPEWIAADEDAYVATAAALAADSGLRARLRAELRGEMLRSPLMDAPAQAARFGAALREMAARPSASERKVA